MRKKKSSKGWIIGGVAILLGAGAFWFLTQGTQGGREVEYRYGKVTVGELARSSSSTGTLVPLTLVDIRSKAGGEVVRLAVEEGTRVARGDLIAEIDPRDVQALFDQASADLTSATTRVASAANNSTIERNTFENSLRDAQIRLEQAKINLARAREEAVAQPKLTAAEIASAEANVSAQQEALRQLQEIQIPQRRSEAETAVSRAQIDLENAESELARREGLLEKGFIAGSQVEQARGSLAAARAANTTAKQRLSTLEASFTSEVRAAQARIRQAEESLRQARANGNRVTLAEQSVRDAEQNVAAARVNLERAKDSRLNITARNLDTQNARASAVRSRVSVQNARVQLDSTRVLAPRAGVVTVKYLEEGTIIPPGTSTFSQGTAIVQIADTTRMFVECTVDEADIASVREGQDVRITVEAYPGQPFPGVVRKIFPSATSANAITSIRVRVEFTGLADVDASKTPLRPGMNATCEFIQFSIPDALLLPSQALRNDAQGTYVLVKSSDPKKPERRSIEVGRRGNEFVQVVSGLNEGDEVVTAEIDLAALRDRQQRMEQAQQGGGFGSQRQGGPSTSRAPGGGGGPGAGGGGGRPGGGAGGGAR
ncbi:MAG: efflux RND transporter periplasmic adaptor subunit [Fimbriimonadaceae bacterium]|jgi:HlyD family secretion protein|nr:efflux RND transporter periplasmic adaptor subunit [Fimbriimonadaceae bacterium]